MTDTTTYPDSPANRVITAFGGPRATAREIDLDHSWVVRWRRPVGEGGTGGLIPSRHHRKILRRARELGLPLTAADLIED